MLVIAALVDLLREYLLDPSGALADLARTAGGVLLAAARVAAVPAAVVAAGSLLAVGKLHRWRAARLTDEARWVEILAPPTVDREGAAQLWRALHTALQRRPRDRRVYGPLHLAWELHWGDGGAVRLGVWVPGGIAPGLVERAVEGAWPGARTVTHVPPPDPLPPAARVAGGELRLGQPGRYPLDTEQEADPLRPLLAAASQPETGESAAVQILLRPAPMRRLRRVLHDAWLIRTGQPTTAAGRFLDLLSPGPVVDRTAIQRPAVAADVRSIQAKAAGLPGWEAAVRYGVAAPPTDSPRRDRARLRGRAHALASSYGVYQGRNHLRRRRLRHPAAALACRALARGDLLSTPEVAVLAHLPSDTIVRESPVLARVPPPPGPTSLKPAASSAMPTPAHPGRSPWRSPMPATTSMSSAPPAPASRRCWPTSSCKTSRRAAARSWSNPKATWSTTCSTGCPPRSPTGSC